MSLVTLKEALELADRTQSALGAFNVNAWEMIPAMLRAGELAQVPIVIQAQWPFLQHVGVDLFVEHTRFLAEKTSIPIVLQLDHAKEWDQVMCCLRAGFSSVMMDASDLPYAENIAVVADVVRAAHGMGVSVESELGKVAGREGDIVVSATEATFTDPDEAANFVKQTGIDALAVSVGTVHGAYHGEPKLDFERLARIKDLVQVPLVLHGASGVSADALQSAMRLGVRKVNFATELKQAWSEAMRRTDGDDPLAGLRSVEDDVQHVVEEKLAILNRRQA